MKTLWSLEKCFRESAKLDDKSKRGQMIFFHKIFARFSKVLVFNKDLRDTEGILKFAQNCVDTSQNLKNVTRCRQVWWNELWKNTLKLFFRRKDSFSWKKFSDDYLILTETILYLINCTINVERLRGPLNNFFEVCHFR